MRPPLPQFLCPECGRPLPEPNPELTCPAGCGVFSERDGMFRLLSADRREDVAPFLGQYRAVRAREGYRLRTPHYYRALPNVTPGDRHAAEWRIRRETFRTLLREVFAATERHPLQVLDVGAGNGWLSHQLALLGHRVVAVDLLDDEADGLGACRYYSTAFTAVQADFERLPFAPAQFDCVVFNGALHYARDVVATVRDAARLLTADGVLAVADSPFFHHEEDGHAMLRDKRRLFAREHGIDDPIEQGAGFVTFAELAAAATVVDRRGEFFPSKGALVWRVRRQLSRYRLGRRPAAFGVWVAR